MQSELSLKQAFLIVGVMVIVFFSAMRISGKSIVTAQNVASIEHTDIITDQISSGLPVRLKIPKISVDAVVESVGLTPQGAMDVPKGPTTVAWFDEGSRPGEIGNAVIAGHFGWKNNIPAIFDDLSQLQKGDKIYTQDENGSTTTFVVRDLKTYGEHDNDANVFDAKDGGAHLNLITCEGVWNAVKKSYSGRLVVFADKE